MQTGTVSRLRFCGRSWGFKIHFWRNIVHFWGSHTFVPISWMCKKQTSVSHRSTESEIVSLNAGLRLDGIPCSRFMGSDCFFFWETRFRLRKTGRTRCQSQRSKISRNNQRVESQWLFSLKRPNFRIKKLCWMCLRTKKQWLRWPSRKESHNETCFQDPQSWRLIGYSIESTWTEKSKSSTSTPKTNLPTS